jgi:hypothetical protein
MVDIETSDDCDIQYDEYLVECCKAWRDGGFVKGYRHWNKGKYSFKCINKNDTRIYTVSVDGTRKTPITLAGIRDELEDLWVDMCDAWYDYSRTNDFQDDECDFDDETDWLDVSHTLINADTIESFMD